MIKGLQGKFIGKTTTSLALGLALAACSVHAEISHSNVTLGQLAQSVKPKDVTIYTMLNCGYCQQAKRWLTANRFAFTECDISARVSCEREFNTLHGDGVPLLVVKRGGKQYIMDEGFDAAEFLSFVAAAP